MEAPKDIYDFLSIQISKNPELQPMTSSELKALESNIDFWEELSEHVDCMRICDECHLPMIEGFCIDDGRENYCSEECLHSHYSEEEYLDMYKDGEGNSYWTVWWE